MNKITIIGTSHIDIETDIGKTNADLLYNLIENINPDIIFEEISLENYEKIYVNKEDPKNYERRTIKKYIANHNIKNIPIDTLDEPNEFSESHEKVVFALSFKNTKNKELIELISYIDNYINNNDLNNINSKDFENLILKREQLMKDYFYNYMEQIVNYYNIYANHMGENRENIMVKNIIEYKNNITKNNNFNALLLVGVAHKTSIYKKLIDLSNIECDLYYKNKQNGI